MKAWTLGLLWAFVALGGCASVWQRNYEPRLTAASAAEARPAKVTLRQVPWERLQATLTDLAQTRAQSDIAWEEWPPEMKAEADAKLVKALQVSDPPQSIQVLGRSSFKTTEQVDPRGGSLEKFARKIGAEYAIWSNKYLGKADRIVQAPVQHTGFHPIRFYDYRRGRYVSRHSEFEDWTEYVPVVVRADETAWVVYYLKQTGASASD